MSDKKCLCWKYGGNKSGKKRLSKRVGGGELFHPRLLPEKAQRERVAPQIN